MKFTADKDRQENLMYKVILRICVVLLLGIEINWWFFVFYRWMLVFYSIVIHIVLEFSQWISMDQKLNKTIKNIIKVYIIPH